MMACLSHCPYSLEPNPNPSTERLQVLHDEKVVCINQRHVAASGVRRSNLGLGDLQLVGRPSLPFARIDAPEFDLVQGDNDTQNNDLSSSHV